MSSEYETWAMLNDTGEVAQAGPLERDGPIAVIGHNYDGSIQHRVVAGGKLLRYRDNDESALARKVEVSPARRPEYFTK